MCTEFPGTLFEQPLLNLGIRLHGLINKFFVQHYFLFPYFFFIIFRSPDFVHSGILLEVWKMEIG